jgi:PPM family protein phosphatase
MLITYAAITHQGRVRRNNQDNYLVSALDGEEPVVSGLRSSSQKCESGLLAAVADGMGGAAAGEIASREGLTSLSVNLFGRWGRFPAARHRECDLWTALRSATEEASHAVLRYSDEERTARGMGTTLTAAVLWNGCAYIAQVGDSRAYLYRQSRLVQLTSDQTLVNEMMQSGIITAEQARIHPQRSMITQALGAPRPLEVALCRVQLRRGDRLMLSSDGLHGEIASSTLLTIFQAGRPLRETLEGLVEAALQRGGRDNITALLLSLDDPGLPEALPDEPVQVLVPGSRDLEPPEPGLLGRLGRKLTGKP